MFYKPVQLLCRSSYVALYLLLTLDLARKLAQADDRSTLRMLAFLPSLYGFALFGPTLRQMRIARLQLQALLLCALALLALVSGIYRLLARFLDRQASRLGLGIHQLIEPIASETRSVTSTVEPNASVRIFYYTVTALFSQRQPLSSLRRPVPPSEEIAAMSEPSISSSRLSSLQILLVEDNQLNQQLVLLLLQSLGHRADLAANGIDALDAVAQQRYDLILMDIQMPEMDGLEATRAICEIYPVLERPYIIAITANTMQGDREQCLAAGMDDYMTKPIQIAELQGALERAVIGIEQRLQFGNNSNDESVIDKHVLEELRLLETEEQPNVVSLLITLFMKESAPLLEELRLGVMLADADRVRRAAHSLKSSSASLGAHALSSLSAELEKCGRSNCFQHAMPIVQQLEREYARVCKALECEQRGST